MSGSLTFTRLDEVKMTPQQAAAALAAVAYHNPSRNPSSTDRAVRFTLAETYSSYTTQSGSCTVGVAPVNDPPNITISQDVLNFVEDGPPLQLAPALTLFDVDSEDMSGAEVWIEPEVDKDLLYFPPGALEGLSVMSQKVSDFRLRLYPLASIIDYQAALRKVEFKSFNQNPILLNRTLRVQVTDVAAADSIGGSATAFANRSITITPVNDAPVRPTFALHA